MTFFGFCATDARDYNRVGERVCAGEIGVISGALPVVSKSVATDWKTRAKKGGNIMLNGR